MKTIPSWVGKVTHIWLPQLGGGVWYQGGSTLKAVKPVLKEYPRPVLLGLRSDAKQEGYRFDLDTWSPNAETYDYWSGAERCSTEHVLKIMEGGNCEFMWSMPTVDKFSPTPYADGVAKGTGYPWQTAEYYAAYLQYLIGQANPHFANPNAVVKSVLLQKMKTSYPFFTDSTCMTINKESEMAVGNNWANLRAKRGHFKPYPIQAVVLGIEPYGDAQESMQIDGNDSGARYGEIVMRFRNAIRNRGMKNIPLGLNIAGFYPMSDFERPWFKPLFDVLGSAKSDFSYLDMDHLYHFGTPGQEQNRIFPTMESEVGWQNHWIPKTQWKADYTRYLWMWEDVRVALKQVGEDPSRWKLGCAEHGLAITSGFKGNDMGAGLHWALWLSESMRYNAVWDMNWNLMETGFSHAQIQYRDGKITRTPAHYVYKMVQEFWGFEHVANSYVSPTSAVGVDNGANYVSADVVVRTFKSPDGNYHLFVINKGTKIIIMDGWEQWTLKSFKMLTADTFEDQNPIGNHNGMWHSETVKTQSVKTAGEFFKSARNGQLYIPPISVNHIELS